MDTALYWISQIVWVLVRPESWIMGAVGFGVLALWRGWRVTARRVLSAVFAVLLVIGVFPVGA
jgi:hypothetical protein